MAPPVATVATDLTGAALPPGPDFMKGFQSTYPRCLFSLGDFLPPGDFLQQIYMSHEKNPGWLGFYRGLYYPVIWGL